MRNETRKQFEAYCNQVATLNGVADAAKKFAVTTPVEQTLESRIQDSSEFMSRINVIGVTDQQGEKLGLGIGSTIAGTTDTTVQDRATQDPTTLDGQGYLCTQTNFDTHVTYAKLDTWARYKDFQARMRDAIIKRIALDRMTIGWNGTSRAATSDRVANPLLQDVNIGWLQKVRDADPARIMSEVVAASGAVNVGATGDYKNLDSLVFDVTNNLIEPWYQDDTELVAIIGRQLLADKYFPLLETYEQPSENRALDLIISGKRVGGLPAVRVPNFPANTIAVTRLDNLSVYYQEGSRRRHIVENAKRDRIEDYQSVNEAYVVEDLGAFAAVENIALV
jgi:P2 family phage major capsid protein